MVRFSRCPQSFHLEISPDLNLDDELARQVIFRTTLSHDRRTVFGHLLLPTTVIDKRIDGRQPLVRLTDCSCSLIEREQPNNPKHRAYQQACMQVLKAEVSGLQMVSQRGPQTMCSWPDDDACVHFMRVASSDSSLLEQCRLDKELLSTCRTFFDTAHRCFASGMLDSNSYGPGMDNKVKSEKKLFEWFKVSQNSLLRVVDWIVTIT